MDSKWINVDLVNLIFLQFIYKIYFNVFINYKLFFRLVDAEIATILRERFEACVMYERPDHVEKCDPLLKTYEDATTNYFIKCKFSVNEC